MKLCLFLVIIYENVFILFEAVVKITVPYFMKMAFLDFKNTHNVNEKFLSLRVVIRIIILGIFLLPT